jgi:CHAD domain-containing protein
MSDTHTDNSNNGGAAANNLQAEERSALENLAAGTGAQARQAQIILDWAGGLDKAQIAGKVRLSANTVARNIRAFEARRMDAFTKAPARAAARRGKSAATGEPSPAAAVRVTVEDLCRQYDVDMRHATHVAELAHQLFALTMPLHQLDERYLDIIYIAGLLHNVAYASDPKKHHTHGRDILLATPLSNVSDADRAIIAVATAFHRKSWSPDRLQKEKSYASLPAASQTAALWLSAILRIADGLDYSQSQSTGLTESMIGKEVCLIGVKGPHDKVDRSRANVKADMWRSVTGISLSAGSRKDVRQALRRRVTQRPEPVHISPADAMSEAGRKLLHFHLQRMLFHEPGTRSGANPESVHDMRAAVRRMVSALDVFGGSYKGKTRRSILRGLLLLEEMLGGVRDMDVNIAQAETYLETLPWEARPDLEQLIADWKDLRENNRSRMLRYLDSTKYAEFAERLLTFCETPDADLARSADALPPISVAHSAPAIIYIRYEAVRAYEPVIAEVPVATLHEVRAEARRVRYTLEFFRDVLGSESRDLIELFVRVQDHLGALQDADIASMLIQKYIKREVKRAHQESDGNDPVDISTRLYGINAYLDSRQSQIDSARKSFDPLWADVVSAETRQMFARAVGVL